MCKNVDKRKFLLALQRFVAVLLVAVMSLGIVPLESLAEELTLRGGLNEEFIPTNDLDTRSIYETEAHRRLGSEQSQRRAMYEQLLTGNYFAHELISRFEEMFGVHSATYIRENFTTLFDIGEHEIDEGLLNIIAPMRMVRAEQEFNQAQLNNFVLGDARLESLATLDEMLLYSVLSDGISLDSIIINDSGSISVYLDDLPEEMRNSMMDAPLPAFEPILPSFGLETLDASSFMNTFEIGDFWYVGENQTRIELVGFDEVTSSSHGFEVPLGSNQDIYQNIMPFSLPQGPNIRFVSATNTSVTIELFFDPAIPSWNNSLQMYDWTIVNPPFTGGWVSFFGQSGRPAAQAGTIRFTISHLIPGATYNLRISQFCFVRYGWVFSELLVQTTGRQNASLSATNITTTNFMVNAQFPSSRDHGNQIIFHNGFDWLNASAANHLNSGTFTINGIYRGRGTSVHLRYIDRTRNRLNYRIVSVTLPLAPEQFQSFTRSNTEFRLDSAFVNSFDPGRLNNFMDIANSSYNIIHSLVGGNQPFNGARMRLETSRNMPPWAAGIAGQPIRMAINPSPQWSMIYTARLMNRHNVNMTVLPIHEIAHNFQKPSWNFEPEALAVLKTYYFLARTATSIVIPHRDFTIRGGSGYRYYLRNWGAGSLSYNDAMRQGVYSPYMLGYNLATIAGIIGWEPFRQTFRAFEALHPSQVPNTRIGKFNLFLSMLTDFSRQNVFFMFTPAERAIYQAYFGGVMQQVVVPGSSPPSTPTNINAIDIAANSVTLSWSVPSGNPAGYSIELWCARAGGVIRTINVISASALITHLVSDSQYWVRVQARNIHGVSAWSGWQLFRTNPYRYDIYLAFHLVGAGGILETPFHHASIFVFAHDGRPTWNEFFTHRCPDREMWYFTMGGGQRFVGPLESPTNLVLYSGFNRAQDVRLDIKYAMIPIAMGVDRAIAQRLFDLSYAYDNNAFYFWFPEAILPGTFNSNSFAHGLLIAAGFGRIDIPIMGNLFFPGWNSPLPTAAFGLPGARINGGDLFYEETFIYSEAEIKAAFIRYLYYGIEFDGISDCYYTRDDF